MKNELAVLRTAVERMSEGFAWFDSAGALVMMNLEGLRLLAQQESEVIGLRRQDIWPELDHALSVLSMSTGDDRALPVTIDHAHRMPSGTMAWFHMRIESLADRNEYVFFHDMTKQGIAHAAFDWTNKQLGDDRTYLRLLIDSTAEGLYAVDNRCATTLCNAAFMRMLGFTSMEQVLGRELHGLIHHSHPDGSPYKRHQCPIVRTAQSGVASHVEDEVFFRLDGSSFIVDYYVQPIWKDGVLQGALCTFTDVTERKRAEQRFQSLFHHHTDAIVTCDLDGRFISSNAKMQEVSGYTEEELSQLQMDRLAPDASQAALRHRFKLACEGTAQSFRGQLCDSSGKTIDVETTLIPIIVQQDVIGIYAVVRDITAAAQYERHIEYLASHDSLTGLPNRSLVDDRLRHAIQQRESRPIGIFFLDLNRFKVVNDSLGHDQGDLLLQILAQRMKAALRESDTLGRTGGDEFVVILEGLESAQKLAAAATKLLKAVEQPVQLADHVVSISTSIGISIFPKDGNTTESLLKHADIAMYQAKELGPGNFRFYSAEMNKTALERLLTENSLRLAVERDELVVHYQPRVDALSGAITGTEALVRWMHPERGLILPVDFIPLAEEIGLISKIGEWVLATACSQNRRWQQDGLAPIKISVNLSSYQLRSPGFAAVLQQILANSNLDPHLLELEITETGLMENIDTSLSTLSQIRLLGVSMSIDDFGTGYSSLSRLKKLPVDTLKIDKAFIHSVTDNEDDAMIVSAIISLAHNMGLQVVAEGVTRRDQVKFLTRRQCTEMQGYLFSRPVPAADIPLLLSRRH